MQTDMNVNNTGIDPAEMNATNFTGVTSNCKYTSYNPDSDVERIAKLMASLIFGGFGVFGNVFVIVLAVKYTVKRRLHFLIINMAVSDIFIIFLSLCHHMMGSFGSYSAWWSDIDETIALILCKVFVYFNAIMFIETLVSLTMISIERYKITRRTEISQPMSRKRRIAVIGLCWTIPLVMNVDILFSSRLISINSRKFCVRNSLENAQLLELINATLLLVCYLSMVLLSILTLRKISKPQAIEDSLSEAQRRQRNKRIRNAVKMVLYSLLLYSCCYLPFFILAAIYNTKSHSDCAIWSHLRFFQIYFLPLVYSLVCPVIYCVCLSDFREAARRLLCCGKIPSRLEQRNSVAPSSGRNQNTDM